ncbi:hypothetical protein BDW69DRAFT_184880 [Aspergillus filifer]
MEPLQLHNFTIERADILIEGIRQIHKVLMRYNDAKARNMMVSMGPNGKERVLWIDFDRAETYDEESITAKQHGYIEFEDKIVLQFKNSMKLTLAWMLLQEADVQHGKLKEALLFYCT